MASLLFALVSLASAGRASANGGAVEVFRGAEGSYEIIVAVLPEKPVVGSVHFSITLSDVRTRLLVPDAKVVIVAKDRQGRPIYQARALNTPETPQYYEANITFESPGAWTLLVEVHSDELGAASVTVPLNVEEQSITPGPAGGLVLLGVVVLLLGGGVYVWHSGRQRRASGD